MDNRAARLALWAMGFCVIAAGGCSRGRPLAIWQDSLSSYVFDRGNGDPSVLMEQRARTAASSNRPGRVVFGALDLPANRGTKRDLRGVLVGIVESDERWWYVFLVGTTEVKGTKSRRITELRPVAFSVMDGALDWRTGERNRDSFAKYESARQNKRPAPVAFPAPTDAFLLSFESGVASIRDRASEATWTLALRTKSNAEESSTANKPVDVAEVEQVEEFPEALAGDTVDVTPINVSSNGALPPQEIPTEDSPSQLITTDDSILVIEMTDVDAENNSD